MKNKIIQSFNSFVGEKKNSDLWSPYQKADILAGDMFGAMGLFRLSDIELDQIIDLKKADKLAKKMFGEFGFATLAAKEMEELIDANPKLLRESLVNEAKTISFAKASMLGSKLLNKIKIGTILDTKGGQYEVTGFGQQSNAFKEFEATIDGKEVKVKLTAMYSLKLEVTDDVRSARFNKEEEINSIILESLITEAKIKVTKNEWPYLEFKVGGKLHKVDFDYEDIIDDHGNEGQDQYWLGKDNDGQEWMIDVYANYMGDVEEVHYDTIVKESVVTEKLARGLKPLLTTGTTITKNDGEDALLDLSDQFDKIDDEYAGTIASWLDMAIELMQDGYSGDATKKLKQFNKACKDVLKGKEIGSAFESTVNEAVSKATKIYQISTPAPQSMLVEELENLFGDDYRNIVTEFTEDEGYESVIMFNLSKSDIKKIENNIADVLIWEYSIKKGKEITESLVSEAKKYKFKELAKAWEFVYGEDMEDEYEGFYQEVIGKHKNKVTKSDIAEIWSNVYGEDVTAEYGGFFDNLKENVNAATKLERFNNIEEANADGTISDDEDDAVENMLVDVEYMVDELVNYIKVETEKIGGPFRSPGMEAQCLKLVKATFKKHKVRL